MRDELSRRNFVGGSAGAALAVAPAVLPALGANDKLNIGWIGYGSRGTYVMNMMYKAVAELVTVVAVCDTFEGALARGKDRVQTQEKQTPKTYVDYHELLRDPAVDAVFVASPEHLHYSMTIAALKAGKHVYIEKPLSHTIEEGAEIVRVAERSGKVVQVGTQCRSNSLYVKAKEMVAEGLIGDVHYVRTFEYRNALPSEPIWRNRIDPDLSERTADWGKFLGPAPKRPFDGRRYRQWRLYWDYSSGISTDLMVHHTDITNFVCGTTVPLSCMASGGIYRWVDPDDDREVPDTFSALLEYAGRVHVNFSVYFGNDHFGSGEQFLGNEGTLEVLNRQILNFIPQKFRGKPPAQMAVRKEVSLQVPGSDNIAVQAHVKNFIDAILGKAQVIAPPSIAQQANISGHMATLSYRNNKKIYWDEKTEKYRFS